MNHPEKRARQRVSKKRTPKEIWESAWENGFHIHKFKGMLRRHLDYLRHHSDEKGVIGAMPVVYEDKIFMFLKGAPVTVLELPVKYRGSKWEKYVTQEVCEAV